MVFLDVLLKYYLLGETDGETLACFLSCLVLDQSVAMVVANAIQELTGRKIMLSIGEDIGFEAGVCQH